jgi:hypothetical protein
LLHKRLQAFIHKQMNSVLFQQVSSIHLKQEDSADIPLPPLMRTWHPHSAGSR